MFGDMVDLSGGLDIAYTRSVQCWRFRAPKWLSHSVLIMPTGPCVLGDILTELNKFFKENGDTAPTTICEGVPGPKHIPFVAPNWGTNGHKWELCYSSAHTPSHG